MLIIGITLLQYSPPPSPAAGIVFVGALTMFCSLFSILMEIKNRMKNNVREKLWHGFQRIRKKNLFISLFLGLIVYAIVLIFLRML